MKRPYRLIGLWFQNSKNRTWIKIIESRYALDISGGRDVFADL